MGDSSWGITTFANSPKFPLDVNDGVEDCGHDVSSCNSKNNSPTQFIVKNSLQSYRYIHAFRKHIRTY